MPGRYEIVDEPVETLEVVDDDVYHPDLTVRDTPTSFRSLEPILSGPITLKMIFYDPRWSANKRRCCLCFVALASLVCFSLMISLFVGLGQVLSYINEMDRLKLIGLHMIPDFDLLTDPVVFLYNPDKKYEAAHNKSIAEIEAYLKQYELQTKEFQTCDGTRQPEQGKPCRFDLNWLGTNCTSKNRFGYDDGNPCILFAFRGVNDWTRVITDAFFTENTDLKNARENGRQFDTSHLPLVCSMTPSSTMGAAAEEFSFRYYPDAGFNLTFLANATNPPQLAPLVFVQFVKPFGKMFPQNSVKCKVFIPSTAGKDDFVGVRYVEFEFDDNEDIHGNLLDRP